MDVDVGNECVFGNFGSFLPIGFDWVSCSVISSSHTLLSFFLFLPYSYQTDSQPTQPTLKRTKRKEKKETKRKETKRKDVPTTTNIRPSSRQINLPVHVHVEPPGHARLVRAVLGQDLHAGLIGEDDCD